MTLLTVLLTILFIALKLTHVITWSWLFVIAPIFVVPMIWIIVVLVLFGYILKD